MSEKKRGYMAELDSWADENVITPIWDLARSRKEDRPAEEGDQVLNDVRQAIRDKVLESYRNGQKAGPRTGFARKPRQK